MLDRRRFLLVMQTWMVVAAAALGILTLLHMVTPWILLLFTFLIGFGAVMNDPAWQAITPEVVSEENFAAAVALNSAGYNVGRAVGPAIGGVIIAAAGTGSAFLINAVSIFGVIFFLYRWKRRPHEAAGAARARHARHAHRLRVRPPLARGQGGAGAHRRVQLFRQRAAGHAAADRAALRVHRLRRAARDFSAPALWVEPLPCRLCVGWFR